MKFITKVRQKPEHNQAIATSLKRPLLRIGKTKLLAIGFSSYNQLTIGVYISEGYRKVFWLGEPEDVYFPNMILTFRFSDNRNKSITIYPAMCYVAAEKYEDPTIKCFQPGGLPNSNSDQICIPSLTIADKGSNYSPWSEQLQTYLGDKKSGGVNLHLENEYFKDLYMRSVNHYFMTNFNSELGLGGWPITTVYKQMAAKNKKGSTSVEEALMAYKDMNALEVKALSTDKVNFSHSLLDIVQAMYSRWFDPDEYDDDYDDGYEDDDY